MQSCRWAVCVAVITVVGVLVGAGWASHEPSRTNKEDIWQDEPAEPRRGGRWGLSDEAIKKVMEGLRQRDPATAKELEKLREKDPEKFRTELREHGRPEIEQLARDYWEARRQKRNAQFLEWLKAEYPKDEQCLAKLKDGDPELYAKNFDHLMNQYGHIFDAYTSNPELGGVLKEDYELKKRNDELCRQLRREPSDAKKQELGTELQLVVARRYDLIVRRKEIAYEQLLRRLEDLQKHIQASKDEIVTYKDDRVKQENVRQRVQTLTENKVRFKWD